MERECDLAGQRCDRRRSRAIVECARATQSNRAVGRNYTVPVAHAFAGVDYGYGCVRIRYSNAAGVE